jgi:archaellum component FlaD/FlaE
MKAADLTRIALSTYLKKCDIVHSQIARGHKAQGTYVSYEDDVMLCKHLNLSSRQKNQVIQAINDHRDKSYDVTEESAQPSLLFDSTHDKKKVIANREEERKETQIETNAGEAEAETEMRCEDEDENEETKNEDEKAEEGEEQEETANICEEEQEKNEEETPTSPFQASFISQLQRVSPRLSSTDRIPSS